MPLASSTPTTVGLYINSLKMESSPTGSDPSPYTHLLGVDGYGNSFDTSGGAYNKLDQLFAWMQFYGYNYAILYDTSGSAFVSNGAASEVFTSTGKQYLRALIDKARSYGVTDIGVVCDIFQPNVTVPRYDGTSQIRKIKEYNTDGVTTTNQRIDWINIETEFWNFRYITAPAPNGLNYKFRYTTPYNKVTYTTTGDDPVTCLPIPSTPVMNGSNPYIKLYSMVQIFDPSDPTNYEYRQVVELTSSSTVTLDRALPSTMANATCGWFDMNGVDLDSTGSPRGNVDFKTYNYRLIACYQYILNNSSTFLDSHGGRVQMEAYIGFPNYKAQVGVTQLATLTDSLDRILLTNYTRIPSWSYIDGQYSGGAPSASHRVTDDLSYNNKKIHRLGNIISVESATANNFKCGNINTFFPLYRTDFNFAGYFMEGRSNAGATSGGNVNTCYAESATRVAIPGTGGANPVYDTCGSTPEASYPGGLFPPPLNLTPKSIDDAWQYTVDDPAPVSSPAYSSPTFNEFINTATTAANRVSARINHDTIVIFDQEFMRQLTVSPPLDLVVSISSINPYCPESSSGSATVTVTGGQSPYTYLWDDPLAQTTQTAYGLSAGTYSCTITDATSATTTVSVTLTDPTAIDFDYTVTPSACSGNTGTISVTNPSGGASSSYLYSVTPTGNTPIWVSNPNFTGLAPGNYDVFVQSGAYTPACYAGLTVTVGSTTEPTLAAVVTNETCYENNDGTLTASISSGGLAPFVYTLYTSSMVPITSNSTGLFTGLQAGTYKVRVVDANGCNSSILTRNITQPGLLSGSVTPGPTSCFGSSTGQLTYFYNANFSGQPLMYYNGILTSSTIVTGLPAGVYVTSEVDPTTGCVVDTGTVIIESGASVAANYIVTGVTPGIGNDGSIVLDYVVGTNPISFNWSTGAITDSIYGLAPGTYTVTITDDNGCSITQTFTLANHCKEYSEQYFQEELRKAKCCYVDMSQLVNLYMSIGDRKRLKCIIQKFRLLHMLIKRLDALVVKVGDSNLGCEGVAYLLSLINELCNCTDCKQINRH